MIYVRKVFPGPGSQRGVAAPVLIGVIVVLALIALAAWFLIFKPREAATPVLTQAPVAAASAAAQAPPPADVNSMSVAQLLDEAGKAMRQQRLLAPAGNNAFEFYLKVLEKEPGNQAAQDALRETFPFGANAAEQEINAGNFDEAQREIDILAKADSSNYTLTILRSKLDAQRKLADRAEEQQKKQDELAAQKAATTSTAAAQQPEAPPPVVQTAPQQQQAAEAPKPTPPPVRTQAPAPQPEPVVKTTPAELVTTVNPRYPPQAFRRRQQGWVQVEFTVDTNGDVTNAHVVGTQGSNLFEHAALEAVERWKFRPATSNGQPVTSVLTRRIEFKL